MRSTVIGSYPRVGSEIGDGLRREINKENPDQMRIRQLEKRLTGEVVYEMVSAGIDLPNCGFVDVHDELTWPLQYVHGVEFGGMAKIFHTNTHYRKAIVNGEIQMDGSFVSGLYATASEVHPQVKLELPGPYTMAKHSVLAGGPYKNTKELAYAYARLYGELLQGKNVPFVQFNEPSIIAYRRQHDDIGIVPSLYEMMLDGLNVPVAVWTYYGTYSAEALNMLFSLPVSAVGIDFVWDPDAAGLIRKISPDKGIGFGVVDSGDRGQLKTEDPDEVARTVRDLSGYVDFGRSFLSSNATLEHVARDYARRKLAVISEATRRVNE